MSRNLWSFLIVITLSNIAPAQNIENARPFVENIYSNYSTNPNFSDWHKPEWFSPALRSLIEHDKGTTRAGYVGKLDFDPFCSCQDSEGLRVVKLLVTPGERGHADAQVTLHFPQPTTKTLTLRLILTKDGWRVDDVSTPELSSLKEFLSGKK